jgi:hypothetical protein
MAATFPTESKVHPVEKIFAIKKGICYLNDLGFMFFDNGTMTVRMTIQSITKAFESPQKAAELVIAHPKFFEWVEDKHAADERLEDGRAM